MSRPAGLHFTPLLEEPIRLVLPAAHRLAAAPGPIALTALRDEVWTSSAEGTGHHAMVVGTCRVLGGYEPDLRHRSNDADVQLELVRAGAAVALMTPLAMPAGDPALAVRDIAGPDLRRRLIAVTRDTPAAPALTAFHHAVIDQAARFSHRRPHPEERR